MDSNIIYPDNNTVVSIKKEEGQLKVAVYPNPADGHEGIMIKGISEGHAMLYDLKGELLFEGRFKEGEPLFMDKTQFLYGIYLLYLEVDDTSRAFKLMIK